MSAGVEINGSWYECGYELFEAVEKLKAEIVDQNEFDKVDPKGEYITIGELLEAIKDMDKNAKIQLYSEEEDLFHNCRQITKPKDNSRLMLS